MSITRKTNPYDFTEDELKASKGSNVPPEIRSLLSRQHETLGTQTSMYRKVTAFAQAKAEAMLATRDLHAVEGEMANLAEAKERIATLERQNKALETTAVLTSQQKDAEIMRLTAGPAAAVHSDD